MSPFTSDVPYVFMIQLLNNARISVHAVGFFYITTKMIVVQKTVSSADMSLYFYDLFLVFNNLTRRANFLEQRN